MKFFVIYIEAKGWQSYLLKKKFLKVSIFIYLDIFGEDTSTIIIFINPNLRNNNYLEQDNYIVNIMIVESIFYIFKHIRYELSY